MSHPRSCLLSMCALLVAACGGYYPTWHYAPTSEIHALHVTSGGVPASADPDARIGARLIGILRPEHGGPRRIHSRFDVENCGKRDLVFKTSLARAIPNGAAALAPAEEAADVGVPAGTRSSIEVFFDVPDPSTLSNQALEQLDLSWTVEIDGTPHSSKATFHRAQYADPGPYYYGYGDAYWYGPVYWYDPYCSHYVSHGAGWHSWH
jgi:hypothetical protein